jgi:non-ribosomal peptide synthase protein (TIGR01720 family)
MPLSANGKIDRRALPDPQYLDTDAERGYRGPSDEVEGVLARIWGEVLGVERVGVDDNFFEMGGDSILSIQIMARANRAGLKLSPRQMFEHQTVGELARVVQKGAQARVARQEDKREEKSEGRLTPIQRWFFEQGFDNQSHWNMSVLLEVEQGVDLAALSRAYREVLTQHDALRMRFRRDEQGQWRQAVAEAGQEADLEIIDLSAESDDRLSDKLSEVCGHKQASLDITLGPVTRGVYFGLGEGTRGRLLIVAHHLVTDIVSWQIVIEAIERGYGQAVRGERIELGEKTTSYGEWAERLAEHAREQEVSDEAGYWLDERRQGIGRMPVDKCEEEDVASKERQVVRRLSKEETSQLHREVAKAYRTLINDVLMVGLVKAYERWTGERKVLVDVEGHGREDVGGGVDVTRTVGWFTTISPLVVDISGAEGIGEEIKEVKEQVRGMRRGGIGYGLLRYLGKDEEVSERLRGMAKAEILFNYMGRAGGAAAVGEGKLLRRAKERKGEWREGGGRRTHLLEVNGSIVGEELQMVWTYSEARHDRGTVERLAEWYMEGLREVIRHCQGGGAISYTPSDFLAAKLSQAEIDDLVAELSASDE